MKTRQTLYREQDPRVPRSLVGALLVSFALASGALGVVGLRVQQVHLAYQLDRLHRERAEVETAIRQLEVQIATLTAPSRVEQGARQLGLVAPGREQIRLAREFTPAGTGLAAAHRSRVAAIRDSGTRPSIR